MEIINKNKVHLNDDESLYVHVGGKVIYIDNSTGEMIVDMWDRGEVEVKHLHIQEQA
jgi:hypothetical protein